jgi:hypothetical protein
MSADISPYLSSLPQRPSGVRHPATDHDPTSSRRRGNAVFPLAQTASSQVTRSQQQQYPGKSEPLNDLYATRHR